MPLQHELEEGRRFDLFADNYDADGQYPVRTIVRNDTVLAVRQREPSVVFDVGCGTGQALIELSPSIRLGFGIDVSHRMIDVARKKVAETGARNLEFRFGSFLDFENGKVYDDAGKPDVVMATYALHHLSQDEKRRVLAAVSSVLNENGAIVLGDLMFFEDPDGYESDYARVGYDPRTDRPETADMLALMLEQLGFAVSATPVHPLAGIIIAERTGA